MNRGVIHLEEKKNVLYVGTRHCILTYIRRGTKTATTIQTKNKQKPTHYEQAIAMELWTEKRKKIS